MKFREFRKYISRIDRVSVCMKETLEYENYQFISDVPEKFDDLYLYGIGRISVEFPLRQAVDEAVKLNITVTEENKDEMIYADCIEIMLSKSPRDFDEEDISE